MWVRWSSLVRANRPCQQMTKMFRFIFRVCVCVCVFVLGHAYLGENMLDSAAEAFEQARQTLQRSHRLTHNTSSRKPSSFYVPGIPEMPPGMPGSTPVPCACGDWREVLQRGQEAVNAGYQQYQQRFSSLNSSLGRIIAQGPPRHRNRFL